MREIGMKPDTYTRLEKAVENGQRFEFNGDVRIPVESDHHSGGKKTTVPMGKRPAFRFDCGHHSDEKGQCLKRE